MNEHDTNDPAGLRRRPVRRLLVVAAGTTALALATAAAAQANPHRTATQTPTTASAGAGQAAAPASAPAALAADAQAASQVAASDNGGYGDHGRDRHRTVTLRDTQNHRTAVVNITTLRDGTNLVAVQAWNLTPGFHAFHIHSIGLCDPNGATPFASAGGHFNPTGQPEGMQAGAFPVLLANADGTAHTRFLDGNFRIAQLLGPSGAAIVIHALPDNYANIPTRYTANGVAGPDTTTMATGDAGGRIACGVVAAPRSSATPTSPTAPPMGMPMDTTPAATTTP